MDAETPLTFVTAEPEGYCDPETGICLPPEDQPSDDRMWDTMAERPARAEETGSNG